MRRTTAIARREIGAFFHSPMGAVVLAAFLALRSRVRPLHLALGALVGLVAVGGWVATSTLLFDEFDPLPVQTAAKPHATSPAAS